MRPRGRLSSWRARAGLALCAGLVTAGVTSAAAGASTAGTDVSTLHVAYLSFAVQNSYDAPMLAAAQAAAKANHVVLQVFDANNSTTTQYSQFQDAIAAHRFQGIIVQPIFGTGLLGLVRQAIADKIAVANLDQELGPNLSTDQPQVKGLAVNVVFVPTEIGTKLGQLVDHACARFSSCNVGYLFDIKASALDEAVRGAFNKAIAPDKRVKVVANGQSYFTPSDGLTAVQDMLEAEPNMNLVVGSDQGIEGAQEAIAGAGKTGKVVLVGYGGERGGSTGHPQRCLVRRRGPAARQRGPHRRRGPGELHPHRRRERRGRPGFRAARRRRDHQGQCQPLPRRVAGLRRLRSDRSTGACCSPHRAARDLQAFRRRPCT